MCYRVVLMDNASYFINELLENDKGYVVLNKDIQLGLLNYVDITLLLVKTLQINNPSPHSYFDIAMVFCLFLYSIGNYIVTCIIDSNVFWSVDNNLRPRRN